MERRRRKKRCLKDPPPPPPPSDLPPPLPLLLVLDRPAASPKKSSFLCSLHPFPAPWFPFLSPKLSSRRQKKRGE